MKIFQIESTNYCNASCSYCPHSKMTRKKGTLTPEIFLQAVKVNESDYIGLHHFGEPLLNKFLPEIISMAHYFGIKVEFSTNGNANGNVELVKRVMDAQPYMIRYASDAFNNLEFLRMTTTFNKTTIIKTHSVKYGTKPFTTFAGAVEGESQIKGECYFKKYQYTCVLWDGRVVPCCCDYDGVEVIGDIWSGVAFKENYDLCKKCSGYQFTEGGLWKEE